MRVTLGQSRQSVCFVPDTAEDGDLLMDILEDMDLSPENRVEDGTRAVWVGFGKRHHRDVLTELAEELLEDWKYGYPNL